MKRFLSLSRIRFLIATLLALGLMLIPTTGAYAAPTLRDFYYGAEEISCGGIGDLLVGQTFEATSDYSVTSVKFNIKQALGDPGNVYVYLMETDGSGLPSGSYLATAMRSSYSTGWLEWTFSSSYTVISGEVYALVISQPDATTWPEPENEVIFWGDEDGTYDDGGYVYKFGEGAWQHDTTFYVDLSFEVYGGPPDYYVDDDNYPGPGNGSLADPFCKIQDAIDAATGTTITVLPGTYDEDLFINKSNLTIKSTWSKNSFECKIKKGSEK